MRAWLGRSAAAARLASDRADLWLPAALAWIVSVGWLPFALVVVPLPAEGELVAFGARIFTSGLWPLNAIILVAGVLAAVCVALVLRAVGEAALARATASVDGRWPAQGRYGHASRDVASLFVVRLITAVPTAMALLAAGVVLNAVAPDEFQSPDIGGEVYVRIAGRSLAAIVVLVLALVVGAVLAAVAGGRATGARPQTLGAALGDSFADLARRPGPLLAVAFGTLVGGGLYLLGCFMLLRVLWAPLEAALLRSPPIDAGEILLLVGFVAIWLCLVLGGGAVHAWASAWWALELRADRGRRHEPTSAAEGIRPA